MFISYHSYHLLYYCRTLDQLCQFLSPLHADDVDDDDGCPLPQTSLLKKGTDGGGAERKRWAAGLEMENMGRNVVTYPRLTNGERLNEGRCT